MTVRRSPLITAIGANPVAVRWIGSLLSANMNSTSDQAITIASTNWLPVAIWVTNASTSLTTAAGGIYPATSKGGTALVANSQVYSALTAVTKAVSLTLAANIATTRLTVGTIYLSLTTPQGSAATADVYVLGLDLS